ncbi:maleylacetoacetate isomerase [Sphingobium sp. SYK-6]|uniref:maleylacetoacetate isomerase n=1 Tax=Sphingobium sp. (strain NBRC 103272 / SYK-6) TaxID=627192 RepID=UPI0002276892|nr:maleylacetoacetate isomerase [Sphingobium sp. SYK-6]BAK65314.1 maleylacetoacetate isomerase [Sphingobium sp. SYK-6]
MTAPGPLILHDYWRSGASYRVRIALNIKGLAYEQVAHDLRTGAQRAPDYLALNLQGLVPALVTDGGLLTQSLAIIEYLDETCPDPPLLPEGAADRAMVRAMAAAIACDIHPLHNARVLGWLGDALGADEPARQRWIAHWVGTGFTALEAMIRQHGRGFAFGSRLSLVDCCLVPQLYAARRFGVALESFPALIEAAENAAGDPRVAAAHPDRQPDAPEAAAPHI